MFRPGPPGGAGAWVKVLVSVSTTDQEASQRRAASACASASSSWTAPEPVSSPVAGSKSFPVATRFPPTETSFTGNS